MPFTLTQTAARSFMCRATGLDAGFRDVSAALDHLGFVQIDPINVCGRMQDLILRNRVRDYHEHDLMRHVHRPGLRSAFEHHLPDSSNLGALPLEAWRHLLREMEARSKTDSQWCGGLNASEKKLASRLLAQMADEGPLCSQDIESDRKTKDHAWGATTEAKSTLQKLFFHGRVLIARRAGNRRYYDLPENVLPSSILNATTPTAAETNRWLALLKLRQRRMVTLKAKEISHVANEVQSLHVSDADTPQLYCLKSDLPLLEEPPLTKKPMLIAPLDPVIYDRRITETLWSFDYRWEVYTPAHKRVRGYYALPLLSKGQFAGHADLKADREAGKLQIISKQVSRGHALSSAVKELATFLDLS
jgi:uncharacterized protein